MQKPVVEVSGVSQEFGKFKALDNVDLVVHEGETFGLLGPNGAGKSTLIAILSSLAEPTTGKAHVYGRRDRSLIGLAPQENSFYGELTCTENLLLFARLYGVPDKTAKERASSTLAMLDLTEKAGARAETLSGGMKRRLNLACALMHEPKLLILDEPSVGLDPTARRGLWAAISRLKGKGMTIVITTHYLDEADYLCDRLLFLQRGKVVAEGTPAALKRKMLSEVRLTLTDGVGKRDRRTLTGLAHRMEGETLVVMTNEPEKALPRLVRHFGGRLRSAEARNPSLEDFFIELTGGAK